MHFEFQLLIVMVFIGILVRKWDWRKWFAVGLLIVGWIVYNLMKH